MSVPESKCRGTAFVERGVVGARVFPSKSTAELCRVLQASQGCECFAVSAEYVSLAGPEGRHFRLVFSQNISRKPPQVGIGESVDDLSL